MNSSKPNDMNKKNRCHSIDSNVGGFPAYVNAGTSGLAAVAASASNQTVTHGDVTLSLSEVAFDGNFLKMTVRQEPGTVS